MMLDDNDIPGLLDLYERGLGQSGGPVSLIDCASIRGASLHMAAQATQRLCVFTRDLDGPIYDNLDFLESVKRLALRSVPYIPVRILLFDAQPAVRDNHRLIELARHLTSRVQILKVPDDFEQETRAYMIADERGYVLREMADVYEATADFDAPGRARELTRHFESIWQLGDVHQDLRRLYL